MNKIKVVFTSRETGKRAEIPAGTSLYTEMAARLHQGMDLHVIPCAFGSYAVMRVE